LPITEDQVRRAFDAMRAASRLQSDAPLKSLTTPEELHVVALY
jgi:hypothetical protein